MDLKLRVRQYMTEQNMLAPGDQVLVGLSGGADSVCLLRILTDLRPEMNLHLTAVHVNHGIRGQEADEDAAFAEELCRKLSVPFRLCRADVPAIAAESGMSLEEAGRQERYRYFREEVEKIQAEQAESDEADENIPFSNQERPIGCTGKKTGRICIATAHHMDDQAETVLMNLCRGSGIRGMGGIAPVSGDIIRPLLCVRKSEIREWLEEQGQDWREDGTNRDMEYTRNRIRMEVLPELTEHVNVRTTEHLAALAEQARELDEWLDTEAMRWICEQGADKEDGCVFNCDSFNRLPKALRIRILHRLLAKIAGRAKDLTARHLTAVDHLSENGRSGSLDLPYGLRAVCREKKVWIGKADELPEPEVLLMPDVQAEYQVLTPDRREKFPEKRYTKWFDYDKIKGTVLLRTRRADDILALGGVGHKSLRRYMIDIHIPAEIRDRIPVLACGNEILWVAGYRMSADYQVTEATKQVLAVTLTPKMERDDPEREDENHE